jgi:replicative DNA helicase
MKHITESIVKYKEYKEELKNGKSQGLLTPYSNLNSKLKNGLPWNTITTIAALSGVGKTTLLTNICFAAPILNPNTAVLIFSLEMPGRALIARRLSNMFKMTTKDLENPEYDIDYSMLEDLEKLPIYTDEEGGTADTIYNKMDTFIRKFDSTTNILIGIDHSLLVDGDDENNKMARLTSLINRLKLKYLNVSFIILSQLNDSVLKEERVNKKGLLLYPMYTDLMYGRTLFQISDTVIAMNVPSKYIDEELNSSNKRYTKEYGGLPLFVKKNGTNIPLVYGHIIKGRDTGTSIVAWASQLEHNELKEVSIDNI